MANRKFHLQHDNSEFLAAATAMAHSQDEDFSAVDGRVDAFDMVGDSAFRRLDSPKWPSNPRWFG